MENDDNISIFNFYGTDEEDEIEIDPIYDNIKIQEEDLSDEEENDKNKIKKEIKAFINDERL
jgi:hypothetical protein